MTHRYTRQEKGKWSAGPGRAPRRTPVQIPESDTSNLIEANRLTLIGRVTNPSIQVTKDLVEFFPAFWNMEGRVTGRDLGPDKFQFRFRNENDLLMVLTKGPYHYKKWMLILQRWEPIVSEAFPSVITFWIRIHGIPLHYWTDQTISTIGKELGLISESDVDKAKIRVDINGLRPLETQLEICLPSGEITTVMFEYDKLEKHCFTCFSLSHEAKDCPKGTEADLRSDRPLGINQRNTLEKIGESKRRHDDRRGYKPPVPYSTSLSLPERHHEPIKEGRYSREKSYDNRASVRGPVHRSISGRDSSRDHSRHSVTLDNRNSYHSRPLHRDVSPRRELPRKSSSFRESSHKESSPDRITSNPASLRSNEDRDRTSSRGNARSYHSQRSPEATSTRSTRTQSTHTPPPRPNREPIPHFAKPVSGGTGGSSSERRSALERLSKKSSVMDRLSLPFSAVAQRGEERQLESDNFHNVTVTLTETAHQDLCISRKDRLSTDGTSSGRRRSTREKVIPARVQEMQETGAVNSTSLETPVMARKKPHKSTVVSKTQPSKGVGKCKVARATIRKKGVKGSPLHGANLKKLNAVRVQNPPKKKLCMGVSNTLPCDKDMAGPSGAAPSVFTRITGSQEVDGNVVDFRSPRNPLP